MEEFSTFTPCWNYHAQVIVNTLKLTMFPCSYSNLYRGRISLLFFFFFFFFLFSGASCILATMPPILNEHVCTESKLLCLFSFLKLKLCDSELVSFAILVYKLWLKCSSFFLLFLLWLIAVAVNYVAISEALGVSPSVLAAGVAADNVICALYFSVLLSLASKIPPEGFDIN